MSVIREIKFHELEKDMFVQAKRNNDGMLDTYVVDYVVNVHQHENPIEVHLKRCSTNCVVSFVEDEFNKIGFILVGVMNETGVEWFNPPTQQETISEPDPTTHDSYIQAIVVDGEKMELGRTVGAGKVTRIKKVLGTEKNVFVFLNKNGAVLGEFHVGGHSDLSIVYGFREMEGEE